MKIANYKKSIGWGLLVLFTVFINVTVARFQFSSDIVLYKMCDLWFFLSQIIQVSAVLFIAFKTYQNIHLSKQNH